MNRMNRMKRMYTVHGEYEGCDVIDNYGDVGGGDDREEGGVLKLGFDFGTMRNLH